ncbi:MAG: META domain-containing protein [Methanobacteriota archaeon]
MRVLLVCVVISAVLLVLVAGCTSQTAIKPASPIPTSISTTVPITVSTEITPVQTPAPIVDASLSGTWYLKLMSEQNGTAQVQMINPETTVIFEREANISGYSGCNNYMGQYTLTGKTGTNGKGISIAPLVSTKKYCADSSATETTYLQIVQAATSYLVNENQELSIMDNLGNSLVYQRNPYTATSVPIGT